jgi:CheY-like chemotaxis protein
MEELPDILVTTFYSKTSPAGPTTMNPQIDQTVQAEPSHLEPPNPRQKPHPSGLGDAIPPEPIRLLILEDMLELAELLRENLILQGFEVETAPDGATALVLLRERPFHAALVDIDLPDINGFEVVAQARAEGSLRNARIVFCTGGFVEERSLLAAQFRGSRFISKPFAIKSLLACIADVLQASELPQVPCDIAPIPSQPLKSTSEHLP